MACGLRLGGIAAAFSALSLCAPAAAQPAGDGIVPAKPQTDSAATGGEVATPTGQAADGDAGSSATTTSLSWVREPGAESCISTRALARLVERLIGRSVFVSASQADVSVEAQVKRFQNPPLWRIRIVVSDSGGAILGTRELESAEPDCAALDEQLALVIAVTIDPEEASTWLPRLLEQAELPENDPAILLLRELEREQQARDASSLQQSRDDDRFLEFDSATPPERESPNSSQPAPEPPASDDGYRFSLIPGGNLGTGMQPEIGAGVSLSAAAELLGFWPLYIDISWSFDDHIAVEPGEARFAVVDGAVSLCPLTPDLGVRLTALCAGVEGGILLSKARGYTQNHDEQTPLVGGKLLALVQVTLAEPVFLALALGAVVPFIRDRFEFDTGVERTLLFQPDPVAVRLDFGLGVGVF